MTVELLAAAAAPASATAAAADDDDEGSTPAALSAARRMDEVNCGDRDSPTDDWSSGSDSGSGDCGVCRSGIISFVGHADCVASTVSSEVDPDGPLNRVLRQASNCSLGVSRARRPSRLSNRGAAAGVAGAGAGVLSIGAMVLNCRKARSFIPRFPALNYY